ncbi:MAG: site-specific integrase [Tetragenococcus koreensis]|nr:site-specific integrase [Tetragenococcus koreensis]
MPRKKEMLFCDYYDEWVETYKEGAIASVTLDKYYNNGKKLREICPKLLVSDLNRREYQKIINEYGKTHEKQTVTDFHHQVKSCVKDMFYDGMVDKDPTYKCVIKGLPKKERKKKYLQKSELQTLVHSLDLSEINRDWMVLILAKTGLRYAEVLALTPNDFDFKNNLLTVDKTWNYKATTGGFQSTKTNTSNRTIVLDWQIVGQFQPMIKDLPEDEPIFVPKNKNGEYKRMFNSTINNYLAKKCKDLGITVISAHALRHTHASILLAEGVSINSISNRLGHSDVTITQETYAHILDELKEKDNNKMMSILMQIA